MVNYPPYVDAYGRLKELFQKIREAAVPAKFTQDFISTKLGLKSSSFRVMPNLLKRLGLIDEATVPTQSYKDYRDDKKSKTVMAKRIKVAYSELFSANEYAYQLKKEDLLSKLTTLLGVSKDDKNIPKVAATFMELCKLADFESEVPTKENVPKKTENHELKKEGLSHKLGISYTINLNLPATPDVEVFNAIFKSLKENLLK